MDAVCTLISGSRGFFLGAIGQKSLLERYCPEVSHVILVEGRKYPEQALRYLKRIGWDVRVIPQLRTKKVKFAAARWPNTFTKIRLWGINTFPNYFSGEKTKPFEKVLYMDTDAAPFQPIYKYFNPVEVETMAATCFADNKNRFRSGLLLVKPCKETYVSLVDYTKNSDPNKIGAKLGDQGVLNTYFGNNFKRLDYGYHTVIWSHQSVKNKGRDVIVGHMRPKPWINVDFKPPMSKYVKIWKDAYEETVSIYGTPPSFADNYWSDRAQLPHKR